MTDDALDADARELLDLGREYLAPDTDTVARLRARIETTVAVAGTGIGVVGLVKGLGAKAVAVKLAVVATVGIATGVAIHVVHVVRTSRVSPVLAPTIVPAPEREAHERVRPAIAITTRDVEAVPQPPVVQPAAARPAVAPVVTPAPRAARVQPAPHATLARETELVELATSALRAGDLAAVHDAVATYAHETGGAGQLAEDIGAIEIEALCRANDPSASTKLAAFDARWPHAGQRHRLVAACQGGH